jgi:citrate lyase beta subunit
MPGDDRHKIEKGAALGVDAVIMDLEDAVAQNRKQQARETVALALYELDFGQTERLVRLNAVVEGGLYRDDLQVTMPAHPDAYVIPKVDSAAQVEAVAALLGSIEAAQGWPDGEIKLLAIVETARGVVNLREIAASSPRLEALIFGAEDLAGDIGAIRTPDGWEVFYARSAIVIHARAAGLQAIDSPYVHLENMTGLEADAEQALYMGYSGKLAIHPRQVAPIQHLYTPSAEDIEQARRLIAAYEAHQAAGEGVFALDGKMIDTPMLRAAEQVLSRARMAGID